MADLERVSTETLERKRAAIDEVLKKRALEKGGQEESEFVVLHTRPECSVYTVLIGKVGSGFWKIGFDASEDREAPEYHYLRKCRHHRVTSAKFESLIPIPGAVKE